MPEVGFLYLLCWHDDDKRALHVTGNRYAEHYLGYAKSNVEARVKDHLNGRGARIVRAAVHAGMTPILVKMWEGTRADERKFKRGKNLPRLCPQCKQRKRENSNGR